LSTLNHILQTAMGWTNSHLHSFEADGIIYQMSHPEFPLDDDQMNERGVRLDQVLQTPHAQGLYVYDFGDHWAHEVLVEKIDPGIHEGWLPVCLAGARACPPEDCGGSGGYANLLDALGDVNDTEHDSLLEWIGWPFDPEGFDLNSVNKKLARYRSRVR